MVIKFNVGFTKKSHHNFHKFTARPLIGWKQQQSLDYEISGEILAVNK